MIGMSMSVRWRTEGSTGIAWSWQGPASPSRLQPLRSCSFFPCASERTGAPEKRVL